MDEQELLKRLQQAFREEAGERLISIDNQLMVLENDASEEEVKEAVEIVFRDTHSLKGAARAVGMRPVEMFFQSAEAVFDGLKKDKIKYVDSIASLLQEAISVIEDYLEAPDKPEHTEELNCLCRKLSDYMNDAQDNPEDGTEPDEADAEVAPIFQPGKIPVAEKKIDIQTAEENISMPRQPAEPETEDKAESAAAVDRARKSGSSMRINKEKIDTLLMASDELIALKMIASERMKQINELYVDVDEAGKIRQSLKSVLYRVRGELERLDVDYEDAGDDFCIAMEQLERHLENLGGRLEHFSHQLSTLSCSITDDARQSAKMIDDFREELKTIALMPCSSLTSSFPRMMREIAAETGKELEFIMTGGEIEIDRRILDELRDPLIHLLRNAVDHGIEAPDKRIAVGKSREGLVELNINVTTDKKIELVIRDDGQGISIELLRETVVEKLNLSPEVVAGMSSEKLLNYIFHSGFSTSKIITSISGRGLGMAIVREKVESIGGAIRIENSPGYGCAFVISLPAALSAQRGILFNVGGRRFAMPTNGLLYSTRMRREDIRTVKGIPSISARGKTLPVFELAGLLGLEGGKLKETFPVLVVAMSDFEAALVVEEVLFESEMIVKPMGSLLQKVKNVTGVTVTGSGWIVPVLNTRDLLKSGIRGNSGRPDLNVVEDRPQTKSIMIAEDSITSRTLLTNILEAAGYNVITAVDGMAAWTLLGERKVDMLISDIEMPRLDGFGLTEKVRTEKRLEDLPVVLVTSLARREDRERGIAVGANAYITKGDFSQNHLLDTIERLI
jgi:two-component system chemotaxis sensor kinase CheA